MSRIDLALEQADRALRRATATGVDEAEVRLTVTGAGFTRFARSAIHQDIATEELQLDLRVIRDGAIGWGSTGQADDDGLDKLVHAAHNTVRHASAQQNWPGLPETGAGRIPPTDSPAIEPEHRSAVVSAIVAEGGSDDADLRSATVEMHGLVQSLDTVEVVLNSHGLLAAQHRIACWVVVLARAGAGSGYSEQRAGSLTRIDPSSLAAEARGIALATGEPSPIEPGSYLVLLGPHAVADLVAKTARLTFTGSAVASAESAFEPGVALASKEITIVDDGSNPAGIPSAFDAEGVARAEVTFLQEGRCVSVVHDTRSAARLGVTSTGHALPRPDTLGPLGLNLFLTAGSRNTQDLVAGIGNGLLINRLYYTNALDPKRVVMTGSTRDGVLRIRDGAVVGAVADVRFQQSYLELLANTIELGVERRTVSGWYGGVNVLGDVTVPAALIDGFRID